MYLKNKHDGKWKKSDTEYDSIYMICWERRNSRDRLHISGCQGVVGGEDIRYHDLQGNFTHLSELTKELILLYIGYTLVNLR